MEQIAPGIYVETGYRAVNVGVVVADEGLVAVDVPPFPADARRWRLRLAQLNPSRILFVINTDGHRDRVMGNHWFDAPVIAHELVGERLRGYNGAFPQAYGDALAARDAEAADDLKHVRAVVPQVTFTRKLMLHLAGRPIQLLHMPGPTSGSIWVVCPNEGVVFTGASVVSGVHPNLNEAETKAWLESLVELRRDRFRARTVVPGRGPVTDKAATEAVSTYLRQIRTRVRSLVQAGRPRSDTASLISAFLPMFPISEETRDRTQRRLKTGIDRAFEEIRAEISKEAKETAPAKAAKKK
jgi:glyoxylase-like metal-dependent hydrolase (beta-lactamase superfamily II)